MPQPRRHYLPSQWGQARKEARRLGCSAWKYEDAALGANLPSRGYYVGKELSARIDKSRAMVKLVAVDGEWKGKS